MNLDGNKLDLADFNEDIIFVNSWATWCAPCIEEMPAVEKLRDRFEDKGVAFVLVTEEDAETVMPYLEDTDWSFPVYLTRSEDVPPVFQTRAIPTSYILDAERRIVFQFVGAADWASEESFDFFDRLLAAST